MSRQNYEECERRVLLSEGGYTNNPRDPGGPTNWGITLADARLHWKADATAEDVRAMPRSVAVAIYKPKYWDALRCDDLPSGVDYVVFDYGVNSGIGRAARVYKEFSHLDPVAAVHAICDERLKFLRSLSTYSTFGKGWERRVAAVRLYADHLASEGHPDQAPDAHVSETDGMAKAYGPEETICPQPSPLAAPNDTPATQVAQEVQNAPTASPDGPKTDRGMLWSKQGWAALGVGSGGLATGLQQANDVASQVSQAKYNADQLGLWHVLWIIVSNPALLVAVGTVIVATSIWFEHRRYKRLVEQLKASK